ncbi:polysaccharide deacetylase family protein [Alteromonas gracilis]|nr:polysaccharide deacetylase family protein [Alteromonas gracilis]
MKVGRLLGLDGLTWRSAPNGLYSVNFHRIGNSKETEFDPCVYSCTTEELDAHIKFFKTHFDIISLKTLSEMLLDNTKPSSKLMCLTFDDGYIDNFSNALPVLRANDVTATFFIATGLVGSGHVPWWDKVAYLIKYHQPKSLRLAAWRDDVIFENCQERFIRNVLHAIKSCKLPAQKQINQLEQALLHQNGYPAAEFMDWHHLKTLLESGMELGAHSHNHDILTKLSENELLYELSHSKSLLESSLGCDITAFSYPVGSKSTYDQRVIEGLKDTGYKLAFNFQPGINTSPSTNPYDLHRFPIAPDMTNADIRRMFSYAKRY